jgi:hypothetical protein
MYNEDGERIFDHGLPKCWVICDRCDGDGRVDHPAFSNGITGSEWAEWDEESRQDYLRGAYDVPCPQCKGRGSVKAFDFDAMDDVQRLRANRIERVATGRARERRWISTQQRAEMRMETGEWG